MDEISVEAGDKVIGLIDCSPMQSDHRGLKITIDLSTRDQLMIGPYEYMIY